MQSQHESKDAIATVAGYLDESSSGHDIVPKPACSRGGLALLPVIGIAQPDD